MAQRRMFSKTVTDSARFLRMPAQARLLYYDLGMAADDDGCVEGFTVLQKTGGREDCLRLLEEKGFLKILNEDLVVYILDWGENNRIRKDRYHRSSYWSLVESVLGPQVCQAEDTPAQPEGEPDVRETGRPPEGSQTVSACPPERSQPATGCQPEDSQSVTGCQPEDSQPATGCQPDGSQTAPEDRLGKDRLGKDRLAQDSSGQGSSGRAGPGRWRAGWEEPVNDGPSRAHYGSHQNVYLSNDELFFLMGKLPNFRERLEKFSNFLYRTGDHYDNHYRILWNWQKAVSALPDLEPTG